MSTSFWCKSWRVRILCLHNVSIPARVLLESILDLDKQLFLAINGLSGTNLFDQLMLFISARWPWAVVILSVALVTVIKRQWSALKVVLVSLAVMGCCDAFTAYGLKNNLERSRPCYALEDVNLVQPSCGSKFGFPSNHAANGAAIAMAVFFLTRNLRYSLVLAALVAAVCFSRVYLGVHYPLDVLAGALFGSLFAFTVLKASERLRPTFFKALR